MMSAREASRSDARRYYARELTALRDQLEHDAERIRDTMDELRDEVFYDGNVKTRDELRFALQFAMSARSRVSRALELLPPVIER